MNVQRDALLSILPPQIHEEVLSKDIFSMEEIRVVEVL